MYIGQWLRNVIDCERECFVLVHTYQERIGVIFSRSVVVHSSPATDYLIYWNAGPSHLSNQSGMYWLF